MNNVQKYLMEWSTRYAKHRDIYERRIVEIKEDDNKLIIKRKEGILSYLILPVLNKNDLKGFGKKENITIVTFNTMKSFEELVTNWHLYADYPDLVIMFINPKSNLEKKWLVKPCIHQLVCDDIALRKGLRSIFETVEPLKEKEINELVS